ncbi:hypothetical protein [Novosphingobium huizhouense]|uniref:hypothetical protein n=1 Tax=Novosphingobium huizhouense TaxID=2866625 RepID=UPI001CD89900|nr:hypothetical protein [Novosphingobium huizhouense]
MFLRARTMRLLLVLLAMLTGLSLPQAAAVAAAQSEVAGAELAKAASAMAPDARKSCPLRARQAVPQRRFAPAQRRPIWLPVAALLSGCGFEPSDRSRQ